jgi:antitoxin component of RelBE/YafQ-DinJ toxin-antitoxin module
MDFLFVRLTYILRLYNIYIMTEQVIFKIDKKLKEQAMKKARKEGLPFSVVLKCATQAYVDNEFDIGVSYSPKLIRDVRQAQKEIGEGKVFRGDLQMLLKKV